MGKGHVDAEPAIRRCGASARAAAPQPAQPSMATDPRGRRRAAYAVALMLTCSATAAEDEFAWFRVTGIEGHVGSRYVSDAADNARAGVQSSQKQTDLRGEVFVLTHSYVYHPNFLLLDLGAGPVFERGTSVLDGVETTSHANLYDLTARAAFLQEKPYRGSVYYEHLNPTLSVSPGQVLSQESEAYGLDFSLLDPVSPVPLHLSAARSRQRGSGIDRVIDDRLDQATLRGGRAFGRGGYTQFTYHVTQLESRSGSPQLPTQRTLSGGENAGIDTRIQWGERRQYDFLNLLTYSRQSYSVAPVEVPTVSDARALLRFQAQPSKALTGLGSFSYGQSQRGNRTARNRDAAAGVTYISSPELTASLGVRADDSRATELSVDSAGADASAQYTKRTSFGTGAAGYAIRYERRDQTAALAQVQVVGERVTLVGTTPVTLARTRVIAGSVVVSNTTRTQTYVDGVDYVLTVVGIETRIQRTVGSNIFDGQDVLIDYTYDAGGTFASTQIDQTVNLNWTLQRYGSTYLRYFDSTPRLTAGTPTVPLNRVRSTLIGARMDLALEFGPLQGIGGFVEHENRLETIAPYVRTSHEVYVQTEIPGVTYAGLRLSKRGNRVDSETPTGDSDLVAYDVSAWWRNAAGLDLSASATRERERAAPLPRTRTSGLVRAVWRVRQLTTTLDVSRVRDEQLGQTQTRTFGHLQVRREF